ncbi:MAG: hypothetical protein ACYCOU_04305 [Sulfobacillus sp.]
MEGDRSFAGKVGLRGFLRPVIIDDEDQKIQGLVNLAAKDPVVADREIDLPARLGRLNGLVGSAIPNLTKDTQDRASLLSDYLSSNGKGCCRHRAILTGLVMEKLHQRGLFDQLPILHMNDTHAWIEYPGDNGPIIVETMNFSVFKRDLLSNVEVAKISHSTPKELQKLYHYSTVA